MDIAVRVYGLTAGLPKHEQYGLSSQMQRAAVSIASNIAEGHAKSFTKDYLRHLAIARGSLAELETQLMITVRLNYLDAKSVGVVLQSLDELSRMLRSLQKALRSKLP